ncbi:MAG: helix-turn-helix transcriptional regulator [Cyclobacteriaceae bacterium]|nr:helix-turn-helix transcriptional regulator [Cyclobacteriaceae bacterium]
MQQSQFILQQGVSGTLELFPHMKEFGLRKNSTIQLDSFVQEKSDCLNLFFIVDGKFDWVIEGEHYVLYPGDVALALPDQEIGGAKGYYDIGTFFWLQLKVEKSSPDGRISIGRWSNLSEEERRTIGKILMLNNLPVLKIKEVAGIFQEMRSEILSQELGFVTRVNHLLASLLIIIARQSTRQSGSRRDFPQTFLKLEQALRQNLARQWTVEEMAAMVGLGTTAFTERVKSYTGFTPLHYLINIRISEAIKLLKRPTVNFTDIALDTGFYSSQHFSTTFKKLTGHTPGEFRKRNYANNQHNK